MNIYSYYAVTLKDKNDKFHDKDKFFFSEFQRDKKKIVNVNK